MAKLTIRPDPALFKTPDEFVKAMQEYYGQRSELRMRGGPIIVEEWGTMTNGMWSTTKKPPAELALVTAIKEEIKEAELLGWKVRIVSLETELFDWLISKRPDGLVRDDREFCWRIHGIELGSNTIDEEHAPFFLMGDHPEHGSYCCLCCAEKENNQ